MKEITPPKLLPPFHRTAASGTLPIEQTNDTMATAGPTLGPASVDGQPRRLAVMTANSTAGFVDAGMKTIDAVKLAPLRKMDRASAAAAYEQDDDAAPSPQAMAMERGLSTGSNFVICFFETT